MSKENVKKSLQFKDLIYKDYTGIKNVYKKHDEKSYKGYIWSYRYYSNHKRHIIGSRYLKTLKYKVLKRKLPWIVEEEERARQCYLDDFKANRKVPYFTGIWRVRKVKNINNKHYGCWLYHYRENNEDVRIYDEDLKKLKAKVKAKKYPWIILDKKIAKMTFLENKNHYNLFNSGIDRVNKIVGESIPLGFTWMYYYWEDGERKRKRNNNLLVLERNVKNEKLPWVIFDEEMAEKSYRENEEFLKNHHQKTTSGIYLVFKHKEEELRQGFSWVYKDYSGENLKLISSKNLMELEKIVKSRGLPWVIIDEELAKENYKLYKK